MSLERPKNGQKVSVNRILRLTFELWRDYLSRFFMAQLLALAFLVLGLVPTILYVQIDSITTLKGIVSATRFLFTQFPFYGIVAFLSLLPGIVLYTAFLGSNFGITRDITTGGNYYAGLKNAFFYFRRYWWRYFLVALVFICPAVLFQAIRPGMETWYVPKTIVTVGFFAIMFVWCTIMFLWPAGVTGTGSFLKGFAECFHIFRKNFLILFECFGLFYFPIVVIALILTSWIYPFFLGSSNEPIYILALIIIFLFVHFFLVPLIAICNSCLYNALKNR